MEFYVDGNNGGDYISISQTEEQKQINCATLEVGHCCVVVMRHQVPVEFIASLFCDFMLHNKDGMSRAITDKLSEFAKEVMCYDDDFSKERLSHIVKNDFFGKPIL